MSYFFFSKKYSSTPQKKKEKRRLKRAGLSQRPTPFFFQAHASSLFFLFFFLDFFHPNTYFRLKKYFKLFFIKPNEIYNLGCRLDRLSHETRVDPIYYCLFFYLIFFLNFFKKNFFIFVIIYLGKNKSKKSKLFPDCKLNGLS